MTIQPMTTAYFNILMPLKQAKGVKEGEKNFLLCEDTT